MIRSPHRDVIEGDVKDVKIAAALFIRCLGSTYAEMDQGHNRIPTCNCEVEIIGYRPAIAAAAVDYGVAVAGREHRGVAVRSEITFNCNVSGDIAARWVSQPVERAGGGGVGIDKTIELDEQRAAGLQRETVERAADGNFLVAEVAA